MMVAATAVGVTAMAGTTADVTVAAGTTTDATAAADPVAVAAPAAGVTMWMGRAGEAVDARSTPGSTGGRP
jgi:hypothetical protein